MPSPTPNEQQNFICHEKLRQSVFPPVRGMLEQQMSVAVKQLSV